MKTKMTKASKLLSLVLCAVLIATVALFTVGCSDNQTDTPTDLSSVADASMAEEKPLVKGEGQTVFAFEAVDKEGTVTSFEIHTDKETVGEALQEVGLISGEEGAYGLYVKTVNGVTLDYDTDGMYWGFYENGNYAANGVDKTAIDPAVTYSLKASK